MTKMAAKWLKAIPYFAGVGDTSGRVILSLHPLSASLGDKFVVMCGVARYCLRNLYSSCFQFLPLTIAVRAHFSRLGIKRSASPLALGQRGWTFLWRNPNLVAGCCVVPFKWNRRKLNSTLIYWLHAHTDYKGSMNFFLTACSSAWLTDVTTVQAWVL